MTRSSDFTQLLLPCPSSQAPARACWRPFPRLLSWVRGMAKRPSDPVLISCAWTMEPLELNPALSALGKVAQPL